MSKKNDINSALGDLMGNEPIQRKPIKNEIPQPLGSDELEDSYKVVSIRMSENDKKVLTAHFKRKGIINFSTGIRSIIAEYMDKEGLL